MSSSTATNVIPIQQKLQHLYPGTFNKSLAISGLALFLLFTLLYNHPFMLNKDLFFIEQKWQVLPPNVTTNSPTTINNIMFVILGSVRTWKHRKADIEAWWRENITRGNLWLDEAPTEEFLPWPSSSPPFRINQDVKKMKIYPKLVNPGQVRMYHSILEAFQFENESNNNKDVRWYVMGDDDTVVFLDNLVEALGKYDHTKYYYIGTNSEFIKANYDWSFHMGYGGAGYALSYPLVEALVSKIEGCIERYPHLFVSDYLSHSCLADLRVDLTIQKGFHQIDLRGDISGLLSSHPSSPLITLHHFDNFDPIFPAKTRSESISHLMKAANIDQSRILQQTICYHRQKNWTFSISWGYSAHIYESIFPRSILRKPIETFQGWEKAGPPTYMFNTRLPTNDPCQAPHVFFMETVESSEGLDEVGFTTYGRSSPRNLPECSLNGNHSADPVVKINVFSPATERKEAGEVECCDVEYMADNGIAEVVLRTCMNGEMIA